MPELLGSALLQDVRQQIFKLLGLRLTSNAQHVLVYLKSDLRSLEVNHRVVFLEHVHLSNAV